MSLHIFFALLATLIYLSGVIPYIYHVYHGRVVPHPFSWTVWAILSAINTLYLIETTGWDISSISPVVRTICLFLGGMIGWYFIRKIRVNTFDYLRLFLAAGTIAIAFLYGVSQAVIPTICIDLLVLSPTLKKIWYNPLSEDIIAWITTTLSQAFLLLSLGTYTFDIILFWWYIMSVNALVAVFIFLRTRYLARWKVRIERFFLFLIPWKKS